MSRSGGWFQQWADGFPSSVPVDAELAGQALDREVLPARLPNTPGDTVPGQQRPGRCYIEVLLGEHPLRTPDMGVWGSA